MASNFSNLNELARAWKGRFGHNAGYGDSNDVAAARVLAYKIGELALNAHLDSVVDSMHDIPGVRQTLPPEWHGKRLPAVLLPHWVGMLSGMMAAVLAERGAKDPQEQRKANAFNGEVMTMAAELINVIVTMIENGENVSS